MHIPTIKVKPWGADQGDHVLINECDFDPAVHKRFEVADDPLDHDGDGKAGGSVAGYYATATVGARRKAKRKAKAK